MTSTPVTILSLRSTVASDRPFANQTQFGQLSVCLEASDPGFYIEDTNNEIVKIGPAGYGTTAPNSAYAGASGNSLGEIWFDSSTSPVYLRVWNGFDWALANVGFAQTASAATSAVIASGSLIASGCLLASGAILASGSIGAEIASGVGSAVTVIASGLPSPATTPSGAAYLMTTLSGAYPSGLWIRGGAGWVKV